MILPTTSLLTLLAATATASSSSTNLKGVAPARRALYTPSGSTWKCLDGSKTIPASAINDDYCDCPDGSDEPGTSACPNGTFHCVNAGHIGADIRSSRVGDGLCEPECCDGSDEKPGVCPDRCQEIGEAYRAQQAAINKTRKTGAKIRSTYIDFAKKEKIKLELAIEELKKEVDVKRKEADRTQDLLTSLEALDAASLEIKKQSPLYASLQKHNAAIKALDARSKRFQQTINDLQDLLNDLESGYNPNYVDMAVINTVKAWRKMKGEDEEEAKGEETEAAAPAGEDVPADAPEEADAAPEETEEEKEDAKWNDWEVKQLTERTDYVSLMLEHEKHVSNALGGDQVNSILYSVKEYLPDALLPTYEAAKKALVDTLITMGVIPKPIDNSEELNHARQAKNDAANALSSKENELRNSEESLSKLYDPEWYGKQGEWRKLLDTCLSKDTGEYTYSVCLFGQATQKANKGGMSNSLGSFSSWSKSLSVKPGEPAYYETMHYEHGAQCWNGPQRSVTLKLSCGVENELLSVTEPNKCEYHIVGKTAALCLPLDTPSKDAPKEEGQKDEL